eukprot:TRINITY_DN4771_c0_g1_i1.p2 TRINITY_DN4771_c0_g1~~TRINITY_DN4771_c0_g1_i1.p2  ORF type:complete len:105 (+),score=1.73 TRINITY_DN4771_c0_g1_i1:565-879(+)
MSEMGTRVGWRIRFFIWLMANSWREIVNSEDEGIERERKKTSSSPVEISISKVFFVNVIQGILLALSIACLIGLRFEMFKDKFLEVNLRPPITSLPWSLETFPS